MVTRSGMFSSRAADPESLGGPRAIGAPRERAAARSGTAFLEVDAMADRWAAVRLSFRHGRANVSPELRF